MSKPQKDKKQLRQFGLIMAVMIILVFAALLPWLYNWPFSYIPFGFALAFALPALVHPEILQPVFSLWMKLGHGLGVINSHILLFIIFYLLLLPFGIMARLFGFDPMQKRKNNSSTQSYYDPPCDDQNDMEKPF